jgi:hypothetical protein
LWYLKPDRQQHWLHPAPARDLFFALKVPVDPAFFETGGSHEIGKRSALVHFLIEDSRCLTMAKEQNVRKGEQTPQDIIRNISSGSIKA